MTDPDPDRIRALEDCVAALEEALGLTFTAPPHWRLTKMEERVYGVLSKAKVVPEQRIRIALWWDRIDPPGDTVLKAHISHLRAKLRPFGVEIVNVKGVGYSLRYVLSPVPVHVVQSFSVEAGMLEQVGFA